MFVESILEQALRRNLQWFLGITGIEADGKILGAQFDGDRPHIDPTQWTWKQLGAVVQALDLEHNKKLLLTLLRREELMMVLFLLDKEALIKSLDLFPKEKILFMMMYLPKEIMVKMLLHLFSVVRFVQMMPRSELMNVLENNRIKEDWLVDVMSRLPARHLKKILKRIDRNIEVANMAKPELVGHLENYKKSQLLLGLDALPLVPLMFMVVQFAKKDPMLLTGVTKKFLMDTFSNLPKPMLLQSFEVMEDAMIIEKFLTNLPMKALVVAANQVDTAVLEAFLLAQKPGLLANLAA